MGRDESRHRARDAALVHGPYGGAAATGPGQNLTSIPQYIRGRPLKRTTKKGSAGEALVERQYQHDGFRVFRARPNKAPIWRGGRIAFWVTNSNDIFGVFDGIAVRPDAPMEFLQVCQASGVRTRRRKIEAELTPYWNLGLLNLSYVVRIWELRPEEFRVHTWKGGRDWTVHVVHINPTG